MWSSLFTLYHPGLTKEIIQKTIKRIFFERTTHPSLLKVGNDHPTTIGQIDTAVLTVFGCTINTVKLTAKKHFGGCMWIKLYAFYQIYATMTRNVQVGSFLAWWLTSVSGALRVSELLWNRIGLRLISTFVSHLYFPHYHSCSAKLTPITIMLLLYLDNPFWASASEFHTFCRSNKIS